MSIYGELSEGNVLKGTVSGGQSLSGSADKINVIKGESAYQLAVLNGFKGTEAEWLESLHGRDGKSAYEYAKEKGYDGTEEEFAEMLANAGSGGGGGIIEETDPTVPSWAKQPQKPKYDATEITFIKPDSQSVLPSGTVDDALGEIDLFLRGVPSWSLNPTKPKYTAIEVGALPADTKIPTKTSELENDSGFITKAVSDLENYYKKSEVYSKDEIDKKGFLTDHQDISGKLDASKLPEAINSALAQAKESGEFDGEDGKSAYDYAKDGGYTGTEAELASDLSQISNKADKDYLISVFEELKTAIAGSNIDAAIAVLDKAILDLSKLS